MADKRVSFITGAGRGMGVDVAQAALDGGRAVVATGRTTEAVAGAVGEADDLLVAELDITRLASAEAAVQTALERFGRIDVLVNNAGNFYAGFFEELTPEQIERSLTTNLVGPMNVTRAVLPVMRKQRSAGRRPREARKGSGTVVDEEQPPLRWVAGADSVETVEQKANDLLAQVDAYRDLSSSLAVDEPQAARET